MKERRIHKNRDKKYNIIDRLKRKKIREAEENSTVTGAHTTARALEGDF